jgi:hypothetical protein
MSGKHVPAIPAPGFHRGGVPAQTRGSRPDNPLRTRPGATSALRTPTPTASHNSARFARPDGRTRHPPHSLTMLHALLLAAALVLAAPPTDPVPTRSSVLWTPDSYRTMRFLYERITAPADGVEFAACLRARRDGDAWVVYEVVIPPQSGNSATSIESADCTGYEGAAHSHPLWEEQRACLPSWGDRATFAASSNDFMVVWCDLEAFTFRTKDRGIGGKDDIEPDPRVSTSAEPHLWRGPALADAGR